MRDVTVRFLCSAALATCAVVVSATDASAQVVYRYQGRAFTLFSCGPNSTNTATLSCPNAPAPGNPLTSYRATDLITAVLSFDAPLPANLPLQDIRARAGFHLVMNDGRHTLDSSTGGLNGAEVATDSLGQIVVWDFRIDVTLAPGVISEIETENEPPFAGDVGMLACCDPLVHGDLAQNQNSPGTWSTTTTCEIQFSKTAYATGEAVLVPVFRFANTASSAVAVEIKVWLEPPTGPPIKLVGSGADGSVVLPANSTSDFGGFSLGTVSPQGARGAYGFNCRVFDPTTGRLLGQSLKTFLVQ